MSLTHDDALVARLRESVSDLTPPGPGPDVHLIRMRGSARRRRHRIAAAGSTAAALVLVTSLAVAVTTQGNDSLGSGFAAGQNEAAPADSGTSDPTAVSGILDRALAEAGIAPPQRQAQVVEQSGRAGWEKSWSVSSAQPKIVARVAVYPEGGLSENDYPCPSGRTEALRSCRDDVLSSGVRLLSGEDSSLGLVNEIGQWAMWSPSALAVYPDGRQVSISIGLRVEEGDQVSPEHVQDPGPTTRISLDQLRTFVAHPELTGIDSPR